MGSDRELRKPRSLARVSSLPGWLWKVFGLLILLVVAFEHAALSAYSGSRPALLRREPSSWFHDAQAKFVSPSDIMHLSLLHAGCMDNRKAIVSWEFGASGEPDDAFLFDRNDSRVLDELRRCPDIDIYLEYDIRGGYCEDGVAYAKYLRSRLLPGWVLEDRFFDPKLNREVGYHELCPKTPMLFMNYYWDARPDSPDWPKDKRVYVMPNIEMGQLQADAYWRVDAVLCKTRGCYDRVTKWYEQEGNPRGAKVFYTRHTSTDVASYARLMLGNGAMHQKDFHNVRFTHTAGGSPHKGTVALVHTWLDRPELPPLDIYMSTGLYNWLFRDQLGDQIKRAANLKVYNGTLDPLEFGKLLTESAFFLCSSTIEGYGHYINQARAAGGVIVTTNGHPMNELILQPDTGIYINTKLATHPHMLLGGGYEGEYGLKGVVGLVAEYSSDDIAAAVRRVLEIEPREREAMSKRVQASYHDDTLFFAEQMKVLVDFARAQQ